MLKEFENEKSVILKIMEALAFKDKKIDTAVVCMQDMESSYVMPGMIEDEFSYDVSLSNIVYVLNGENVFSKPVSGEIATSLKINSKFSNYNPEKGITQNNISAGAFANADFINVISEGGNNLSNNNHVKYADRQDIILNTKSYMRNTINSYWLSAYRMKNYARETEEYKEENNSQYVMEGKSEFVPFIKIKKITDIAYFAKHVFASSGIKMFKPDSLFPVYENEDGFCGLRGSYVLDPWLVDFINEMQRLNFSAAEIRDCEYLIQEDYMFISGYENMFEENKFYIALKCYNNFKNNSQMLKDFDKFKKECPVFDNIKFYSEYMAASRILGRIPTGPREIKKISLNEKYKDKWDAYFGLFEYLQYVAYMQLKKSLEIAHENDVKVFFDYSVLKTKDSADVVRNPYAYSDNYGNKHSVFVNGKRHQDFTFLSSGSREIDFEPLLSEIQYWTETFGFDGINIQAVNVYDSFKDSSYSGKILLGVIADNLRSIHSDIVISSESLGENNMGLDINKMKDIYTIINVKDSEQIASENFKNKVKQMDKVWLKLSNSSQEYSFEELCLAAMESGLGDYVSFNPQDFKRDEKGLRYNILQFIEKMRQLTGNNIPDFDKKYFLTGYKEGSAANIKIASKIIYESASRLRKFTLRYNEGKEILSSVSASEIYIFPVLYNQIKDLRDTERKSVLYHAIRGDFIDLAEMILKNYGINRKTSPEVWYSLDKFKKETDSAISPEDKINITIKFFGFMQQF